MYILKVWALLAQELALGDFCIGEVGDDVGEYLLGIFKVIPISNIIGGCSHFND